MAKTYTSEQVQFIKQEEARKRSRLKETLTTRLTKARATAAGLKELAKNLGGEVKRLKKLAGKAASPVASTPGSSRSFSV